MLARMKLRGGAIALALALAARAEEKPADPPLELVPLLPAKPPWMKKKEKPRPPPLERPQTAKKAPVKEKKKPAQAKKVKPGKKSAPEPDAAAPFVAAPPALFLPAPPAPAPAPVAVEAAPPPKPLPEIEPPPLVKAEVVLKAPPIAARPAPPPAAVRSVPAAPQRNWTRPAGLVSLGLGAAAAAVGMYFGARSKSDLNAAETSFQANGGAYRPGDLDSLHSGNSKAHTANALFIAAGVLAGAGLLLTLAF
jgi:hypothetical protein